MGAEARARWELGEVVGRRDDVTSRLTTPTLPLPRSLPAAAKFERPEVVPRKPAVPSARRAAATAAAPSSSSASRSPSTSSSTSSSQQRRRDFVTENAVGAMTARPRGRAPAEAPNWLARDGFGAVPAYLREVKAAVAGEAAAKAAAAAAAAAAAEAAKGRRLSDDERAALVLGLKQRWDEVNAEYQRVTHKRVSSATSIVSEVRFKEKCEGALARLEDDIRRLSAPGPVYVLQE